MALPNKTKVVLVAPAKKKRAPKVIKPSKKKKSKK